jgi:4a-hydroxytetrahydrobiopterin dehydratase
VVECRERQGGIAVIVTDQISPKQFLQSEGIEDWRLVGSDGAMAFFRTGSLAEAAKFVQAISALPGADDARPDIDLRQDGVTVHMITFTKGHGGMRQAHVELARRISAEARKLGIAADTKAIQSLLIIPGAPDIAEVMPFWQAVLGYVPRPDSPSEDLIDPHGRGAGFWFEKMKEPRADGGGAIHICVWVPYEQAQARIAAALAAGGHLVRDDFAPAWWTLADAAGNECDVATIQDRD